MNISVIVPVLNEEKTIGASLACARSISAAPDHRRRRRQRRSNRRDLPPVRCRTSSSERGRARQMNHGARQASGEVLLFLHADTRLPQSAFADIAAALRRAALSRRAFRCRARRTPPDAQNHQRADQLPFARDQSRHRRSGAVRAPRQFLNGWAAFRRFR